MSFRLLRQVIAHLRKQTKCPYCKGFFSEDEVFVLATGLPGPHGKTSGLFLIVCMKCNATALVMVEVTNITEQLKKEAIRIHTKSVQGISVNEILDMHNFLKGWKGNIAELFKETT